MTVLEIAQNRILEAFVVKAEFDLHEISELRAANHQSPDVPCACDSLRSGPGCKPCLVKRGRKTLALYARNVPEGVTS